MYTDKGKISGCLFVMWPPRLLYTKAVLLTCKIWNIKNSLPIILSLGVWEFWEAASGVPSDDRGVEVQVTGGCDRSWYPGGDETERGGRSGCPHTATTPNHRTAGEGQQGSGGGISYFLYISTSTNISQLIIFKEHGMEPSILIHAVFQRERMIFYLVTVINLKPIHYNYGKYSDIVNLQNWYTLFNTRRCWRWMPRWRTYRKNTTFSSQLWTRSVASSWTRRESAVGRSLRWSL